MDYFRFAEATATAYRDRVCQMSISELERAHGSRRPQRQATTHWSYFDQPQYAICGAIIRPEEFNRDPTCPDCQRALAEQRREESA